MKNQKVKSVVDAMAKNRDDFNKATIDALGKRAAFICSRPDCKISTLSPSQADDNKFIYIGKAAHITAASEGGPRYDESLSTEERKSITNGIFLCSNCAEMIDKNNGVDFSVETLKKWKEQHESWVSKNINLSTNNTSTVINVNSNNQSGGITAGIITIVSPQSYQKISKNILSLVQENLKKLITKYNDSCPNIILEIESGHSLRKRVAEDIEKILQDFSLGYFCRNTNIDRFPDHPITVIGTEENIDFLKDFVKSISPYLRTEWFYSIDNTIPNNNLRIYIYGTPSFQTDGLVTIE